LDVDQRQVSTIAIVETGEESRLMEMGKGKGKGKGHE
jgi:hypothetical protein